MNWPTPSFATQGRFLLALLTPLTAMGQTFDPLPEGARIRSEKDGERRIEFKNGIVAHELSEEKIKNQPYYTPEQIRNAILAEIIVPDAPNATTEPVPQSPRVTGPPGSAPSKLPKKNI